MVWKPDVTVAAVVERDGTFLLVEERIEGRLVINQPAGHLEANESLIEAVVRETREETAWRLTPRSFLGAYLWHRPDSGRTTLRFAFIGDVDDLRPNQPLDKGIVRATWKGRADLERMPNRLRSPLVLRCIEDYLAGRRLPLESVASLGLEDATMVESVVNL